MTKEKVEIKLILNGSEFKDSHIQNQSDNSKTLKTGDEQTLSGENNGAASLLDLLLRGLGNKLGLHHNRLRLRQHPLPQHLEVSELRHVDERYVALGRLVLHLLRHQRPQLVHVDDRAVELVPQLVEVPHTDLTEVTWMVLVEQNPVVVHASGVTPTSGMLPVLPDTSMPGTHVASLLPVLAKPRRHFADAADLSPHRLH
uniref:Uncharacterized protein n=1 Tax=Kalanchoe fedtschenkoi TaxID=63787 RepID=A0A7N0U1I4_KALFE